MNFVLEMVLDFSLTRLSCVRSGFRGFRYLAGPNQNRPQTGVKW